jgi:hypothetical protein
MSKAIQGLKTALPVLFFFFLPSEFFIDTLLLFPVYNHFFPLKKETLGRAPTEPKKKGARRRRHVPTSSFWNMKRWISRPPMKLAHRRILHPKDRRALDRDRENRFKEILGHQIYEGLSTFDNETTLAVLRPHAEVRSHFFFGGG